MHRKTNYLHDNARGNSQQQQPNPIASQAQAGINQIDPSMIQQISDQVKNFKFEMANMLSRVRIKFFYSIKFFKNFKKFNI